MLTLEQFSQLAAVVSAMADVYTVGRATFSEYLERRRAAPNFAAKGQALRTALSTFSDAEVEAIKARIEGCRERFIREGSGASRKVCLCSVLSDVRSGNGGTIPDPEWATAYEMLGC